MGGRDRDQTKKDIPDGIVPIQKPNE